MNEPLLAITMGDPAGVGPEIIAAAWPGAMQTGHERRLVIGCPEVMRRAAALRSVRVEVCEIDAPEQAASNATVMACLPCGSADAAHVPAATVDPRGGQAAFDAVVLATELALAGRIDGIVTAPLHKAALHAAGHDFPGHTELLATLCGVDDVAMMLYLPVGDRVGGRAGLGVAHVTLHTALRNVFDQLTAPRIVATAHLADTLMRALLDEADRPAPPRIGVCALNPHAGEDGLFGDEEQRIIAPAIAECRRLGIRAEGPLPCDTLMVHAAAGRFDAVVAMYHDQGHIALKLLDIDRAVNITLGLPIVRTSVAHGTAFDLAWQAKARHDGMQTAIATCTQLIARREELGWEGDCLRQNISTNNAI